MVSLPYGVVEGTVNDIAFCPLLWQSNGGPVDERGHPDIPAGRGIRGNCDRPHDCATCPIMNDSLQNLATLGEGSRWICPDCAAKAVRSAKQQEIKVELAGYYTEGRCQRPSCDRPEQDKYTSFLQLILITGPTVP